MLRLSDEARNIDFHQKGLLSDRIGVGMAATLLGSYLNAPLAADVSVAMHDPTWPIDVQGDASPDYLFFDESQTNLFVVECKGTQTTRYSSIDQLRRGTEQVPSVVFTDGRRPPSLVIATYLAKSGTRVLILDPPGDDPGNERPSRRITGQREWTIEHSDRFTYSTRAISEAKLLSFAGAVDIAATKLKRAEVSFATPRTVPPELETTDNEFGVFRGIRQRVGMRDRLNVEVFQALDLGVFKALQSDDLEELTAQVARYRKPVGSSDDQQTVVSNFEGGVLDVKSVGPDGSLLEIRVSEP